MWAFFTAHALDDLRCAESAADDPVRDSVAKEFLADNGNTGDRATDPQLFHRLRRPYALPHGLAKDGRRK